MEERTKSSASIEPGRPVVLVLHTPKEKCWGILEEIGTAGVFLRGLDLNSFDDWLKSVVQQEPFIGAASLFFPMWRVERLSLDEPSYGIPSLAEQAEKRTGLDVEELLQRS